MLQKPLVYFDSNIYRHIYHNELIIENISDIIPVFSSVHFDEISRGSNSYLLESIKETKSYFLNDDYNILTNEISYNLISDVNVEELFAEYLESQKGFENIGDLINPLQARFNGAKNYETVKALPGKLYQFVNKFKLSYSKKEIEDLTDLFSIYLKDDIQLQTIRKQMGINEKNLEAIKQLENPIEELFRISKLDQYFKQAFTENDGIKKESIDSQVIILHSLLNWFGLWSDKKLANEAKTPNIMADGQHISKAIYCEAFFTVDKNLHSKCKAIYKYLNINTSVLLGEAYPDKVIRSTFSFSNK